MRTYDELPTIIGEMKRAAIDCYMADLDWPVHFAYDDTYALWGYIAANSYRRPAANGEGGGAFTGWADHPSLSPNFDQIRGIIDSWINQWLGLPDGSKCDDPLAATGTAAATFGASGTSPSVEDNGEISTANQTVSDVVVAHVEGNFVTPFYDKYYTQFSSVYYGLGAGCAMLQVNYNVQSAMWKPVREDVVNLCVNATNAWKEQAELTAAEFGKVALTVVGAVAGALASIATAGAATPAVAALVSISAAATSAVAGISASTTISGSSYPEIHNSWTDGLDKLNEAVTTQETALDDMLSEANTYILDNKADFDLDAFSLGSYPGSDGTIAMKQQHATMISTNMERIETVLGGAKSTLGSPPAESPTPRNLAVGLGSQGTHWSASALHSTLATCLAHTVSEYDLGHQLFDATAADFLNTDDQAAANVKKLVASEALTTKW